MKKLLLALVFCVSAIAANAQFQFKSLDVSANFRSDFGLGVGATLETFENLDFSPKFTLFFPSAGTELMVDADFHYNFNVAPQWQIYPIAGLAYFHHGITANGQSVNVDKLGVNLGVGGRYNVTERLGIFAEGKYSWLRDADKAYLSIGVNIRF